MAHENFKVKVVEIILTIAVIFLIVLNTTYIPSIATITMFILPIPITLLYVRNGYKVTLFSIVVSTILVSIKHNLVLTILYTFMYGLVGIVLGYCINKKKKNSFSIIVTSIAIGIGTIVQFIVYSIFIHKQGILKSINLIAEASREPFKIAKDTYVSMGAPTELIDAVNQIIKSITAQQILIILPVIILANSLIQSYINYYITSKVLQKSNLNIDRITTFSIIYIPNLLAAYIIIIACLGIILDSRGITIGTYMSGISMYILRFLFSLNGIAFFAYILRNKFKLSRAASTIILFLGLVIPIFGDIYLIAGTMDIILNLRRLDPNPIRKVKKRE
ncbi:DUF2232 domain-containing protein [Clostridium ganghwense]|uniref:DUF2232 domain-containing protein n=1 Tax=Clostridium ganghwense TaxID=312089 RepID=A0ABT4CT57_9CLOT|nr:DUF2232 domain-containing protein [Clostridium ganghwense]MCY6372252.1 DUF2232 domain-containing protein [Clostridium ganghwense]